MNYWIIDIKGGPIEIDFVRSSTNCVCTCSYLEKNTPIEEFCTEIQYFFKKKLKLILL